MATIQKRGESYRIRAFCGYSANGKQIEKTMTWKPDPSMTERQIKKELERQAILFEEDCQGLSKAANMKFQVFADQWFHDYAEPKLRIKTVERYKKFQPRAYKAIGGLRMDKITPIHIQAFIDNLQEPGIKQGGGTLSPKTVREYLSFVSTIFEYALRMNMLKDNPCRRVTLPPLKQKEREVYTLEEAQKFLELLESEPILYRVFFTLAIYGGFRRGELMGLEWKDIDFDTGIISIQRTSLFATGKGVFTDTTKTKESQRCIKMPAEIIELLRQYKLDQDKQRLKLGDQWIRSDRLFVAWNGKPMNPNTPYSWFYRFCERTEMRKVNIHSFRHLNASLLINAGVDIKTVSASLGHSQTSTTLNIYAHSFAQAQAKASEAVANVLSMKKA